MEKFDGSVSLMAGVLGQPAVVRDMSNKLFILFARRPENPSDQWMRIRSTKLTTNPVTRKAAEAKAREWLQTGWKVQAVNVATQEAHELT